MNLRLVWLGVMAVGGMMGAVRAQNIPMAHWINDAGQSAATVLNTNGVFITTFQATNDLTVTPVTNNNGLTLYTDIFGGATPGNNPSYITQFIGAATNGTGDGTAGDVVDLEMTAATTGTLQFDFATPLTPQDRILLVDVDGAEQYLLQAYVHNGASYNQVGLTNWIVQNYSGTMGIVPDSRWPVWNAGPGILASGYNNNLVEELVVMTPSQDIDRLVVAKIAGAVSWTTDITFESLKNLALPPAWLNILQSSNAVVLSWTNSAFGLQAAPAVTGPYTNVPGATSPYTNALGTSQQFFRLITN